MVETIIPLTRRFLFSSNRYIPTNITRRLSVSRLPHIRLRRGRVTVRCPSVQFNKETLKHQGRVRKRLSIRRTPSKRRTIHRHVELLMVISLSEVSVIRTVPFTNASREHCNLFTTTSSHKKDRDLSQFSNQFMPFVPSTTSNTYISIVGVNTRPIVQGRTRQYTIMKGRVTITIATSRSVTRVPISIRERIRPTSGSFDNRCPISQGVHRGQLIMIMSRMFSHSKGVLLDIGQGHVYQFPPCHNFIGDISEKD